jgi:AcrR family transcriptional regulator
MAAARSGTGQEGAPSSTSPKRDHLVDTASALFYREGFRAVGIDTLLAEAGVAKMTLYNHFSSKEELIVAVLEARSTQLQQALDKSLAEAGRTPARQLAAVFDGLKHFFDSDEFKGCAFIRALSEYPDPQHPIHQTAWAHKRAMNARFLAIAKNAGAKNPPGVADAISLLVDGAIVAAHATRSSEPANQARTAAMSLLKLASE